MNSALEELISDVEKSLLDLSEVEKSPKDWKILTIQEICSKWQKPTYVGAQILSLLRVDPDIRYEFTESRSRFKTKKFYYRKNNRVKKISDIGKKQQFELTSQEEKQVIAKLKEYINDKDLDQFYILGIICEKCKLKSMNRDWIAINTSDFCRSFSVSELEAYNYINDLIKHKILVKYPLSNSYKLTLLDSEYLDAVNEINTIMVNEAENKESAATNDSFKQLDELNGAREDLTSVLKKSEEINSLLVKQLKIYDLLKVKDNLMTKQSIAINTLEKELALLNKQLEELKNKNAELSSIHKQDISYQKARSKHIEQTLSILQSEMITEIENIFQEANGRLTPTQTKILKSSLFNLIYRYSEEARDFHYRKDNS